MSDERLTYTINNQSYIVTVKRKRIKNSYLRCNMDRTAFVLTTNKYTSLVSLDSFIRKSISKFVSRKGKVIEPAYGVNYTYILGKKTELVFSNKTELDNYLKFNLLPLVTERVRYYESLMGINKPFKVKVKDTKTRFGSNSRRTHSLSFCYSLYHFDIAIIDSVVVHELSHYFEFNHSRAFYNVVLQYCPEYKKLHRNLVKKIYGNNN